MDFIKLSLNHVHLSNKPTYILCVCIIGSMLNILTRNKCGVNNRFLGESYLKLLSNKYILNQFIGVIIN